MASGGLRSRQRGSELKAASNSSRATMIRDGRSLPRRNGMSFPIRILNTEKVRSQRGLLSIAKLEAERDALRAALMAIVATDNRIATTMPTELIEAARAALAKGQGE